MGQATGKAKPTSYRIEGGRTEISIPFDPFGSTFVVFRKRTRVMELMVRSDQEEEDYRTPLWAWQIAFQANRGAPATAIFPKLADFRNNSDSGIRYFSGIATYSNELTVPVIKRNRTLLLDLGAVHDIAEVSVNGKLAGTAWKPPYRVDISKAVTPG